MHSITPCKTIHPIDELASYDAAILENPRNAQPSSAGRRTKRAIGIWSKFWGNGRTLRIAFVDTPTQTKRLAIEALIKQWQPSVNLHFEFVDDGESEIRISTYSATNDSAVGTDALLYEQHQPTLNLNIEMDHPEFEATVLHEFGHALGLKHEQQHPKANIPWDKPKVYEFYKTNYGWTDEDTDLNVLTPLQGSDYLSGPYDKDSIMHYPVPNELTTEDWEVGINTKISMLDRRVMRKAYPKFRSIDAV
ncbi:peptidase M12 [Pseudomonas sp. 31-12]|uniref:M12 family metallopeptidase n=1 Tax=Pseudomonas sp. 31-12 TaxID=2201356 RepID=UPI000D6C2A88|nr:M12 family metallopeptidase [Pseudomonas sp. 31-12]AWM90543.1 peptidase M12 [Pseudomonas sp. 31-12]